jgi:hypothetical protein
MFNLDRNSTLEEIRTETEGRHENMTMPFYYLSKKYSENPLEAIRLLHDWLVAHYHGKEHYRELVINLAKNHEGLLFDEIDKWIEDKNSWMRFVIPDIFSVIVIVAPERTIDYLKKKYQSEPELEGLILEIIQHILEAQDKNENDFDISTPASDLLELICKNKEVDISEIRSKMTPHGLLKAVITLKEYYLPMDYGIVLENLKNYPNISKTLGREIEKLISSKRKFHPLLRILNRNDYYSEATLQSLDDNLALFDGEKGIQSMRRGLNNYPEFEKRLSELDICGHIKRKYKLSLDPNVGTKTLDAELILGDEKLMVEITSPDMFSDLVLGTGAVSIPNNAIKVITRKLEKQLNVPDDFEHPILLALDLSSNEIDFVFVRAAISGSDTIIFYTGPEGSKIPPKMSRAADSMYHRDQNAEKISAIFAFKRGMSNGKIEIEGQLYLLNKAKNKLSENMINALKDSFEKIEIFVAH